jgi:OOP family OmpA-OmpF porin
MRLVDALLAGLGGVGLIGLTGWSYLHFPSLAKGYEAALQSRVETALDRENMDWVSVEMDGQTVFLTGASASPTEHARAEQVALSAAGHGGALLGGVTAVETEFDSIILASPFTWRATHTPEGNIVMSGYVPGGDPKSILADQARALTGGPADDRTEVANGAPEGNWLAVADLALASVAELDDGVARLVDTELYVTGVAMDNDRRARLTAEIAGLDAPFVGRSDLRAPSVWSARHVDGVLLLEGEVARDAERDEIYELASQHFDGTVVDEMALASDMPDGLMDTVRSGLPHFAVFQSGWFGFNPDDGGVVITGTAPGSVLTYLTEDMTGLDSAYPVSLEVEDVAVTTSDLADTGDARADCEAGFAAILSAENVVFSSGNAEISRESGAVLDKLMAVAGQCERDLVFEVGGYTDSMGERDYNVYLSGIRAQAVVDYMTGRGFDADRLSAIGYGPEEPIADNATPEGRAANRRIEIKVLEQDE